MNRTSQQQYDLDGDVSASVDAMGRTSRSLYDQAGEVTASLDALGRTTLSQFDSDGEVTKSIDPLRRTSQTQFDTAGQATATIDALNRTSQQQYDLDGEVTKSIDPLGLTSQTLFDAAGQVTATIDALNHTMQQQYDLDGEVTKSIDPIGRTTQSLFDAAGQETASIDALNRTTQQQYDLDGEVTKSIDAVGRTSQTQYDLDGEETASIDSLNRTTQQQYDLDGEVTKSIDPLGFTSLTLFDAAGQETASIDALNRTTQQQYDLDGEVTKTIDPVGQTSQTLYDADGQATATIDALNRTTQQQYDLDGEVTKTIDANGNTSSQQYDNEGRVTASIDANNHTTRQVYDGDDRVTASIDGDGNTTQYRYDSEGNRTAVIDPNLNTTAMAYDADNRLTLQVDPLGHTTAMAYDAGGNQTAVIAPDHSSIVSSYDADNRMTMQVWYESSGGTVDTLRKSYDNAGRLLTASNNNGTYGFGYDADGRVTSVTEPFGVSLGMQYDAGGQQTLLTDSFGGTQGSVYDLDGRLLQRNYNGQGQQLRVDYTYTLQGQVQTVSRYSNLAGTSLVASTMQGYDAIGQVTNIQTYDSGSGTIDQFASQYDFAGNVVNEIDNGVTTAMTYDSSNQLLSAGTQSYAYDPNGNSNNTGASVGTGNQLLSDGTYNYGYDLKGNEISKTEIATGAGWTYGYNNANQLVYAKQWSAPHGLLGMQDLLLDAEYKYDFFGNRIEKDVMQSGATTVTRFAVNGWDPSKSAGVGLENFDEWAIINAGGSLQTRNISGAGVDQPLARIYQSGASDPSGTYWLLTDRLNSVRDVINNSAAVKDSVKYDVYGNIDTASETDVTYRGLYDWTGRDRDAETGLQYNRARYYDSVTARWISQDPMGFDAGDSNLYRYVMNNPVNDSDPSGRFVFGSAGNCALDNLQQWLNYGTGQLTNLTGFGPVKVPDVVKSQQWFDLVPMSGGKRFLKARTSHTYLQEVKAQFQGPRNGAIARQILDALQSGTDNIQVDWMHPGKSLNVPDPRWNSVDGPIGSGDWWTFVPRPISLSDPEKSTINKFYGRDVFPGVSAKPAKPANSINLGPSPISMQEWSKHFPDQNLTKDWWQFVTTDQGNPVAKFTVNLLNVPATVLTVWLRRTERRQSTLTTSDIFMCQMSFLAGPFN